MISAHSSWRTFTSPCAIVITFTRYQSQQSKFLFSECCVVLPNHHVDKSMRRDSGWSPHCTQNDNFECPRMTLRHSPFTPRVALHPARPHTPTRTHGVTGTARPLLPSRERQARRRAMWTVPEQPTYFGQVDCGVDLNYLREASLGQDFRNLCSELLFGQQLCGAAAQQHRTALGHEGPAARTDSGEDDDLASDGGDSSFAASGLRCMDPSHPPSCSRCFFLNAPTRG